VASLTDFIQANTSTPAAINMATMVPQYRVNETAPALQEDAGIATSRALSNYATRQLPQLIGQGAASGQFGGSGLAKRADWLSQDTQNSVSDIQRSLSRNMASIAQRRVLATMGLG
jgi:hypothetical protein